MSNMLGMFTPAKLPDDLPCFRLKYKPHSVALSNGSLYKINTSARGVEGSDSLFSPMRQGETAHMRRNKLANARIEG